MSISNYKDLKVWQKARVLVKEVYMVTEGFPREDLYSLTDQIKRAVISIPSNIAEGFQRNHQKEFLQFLYHSYGSCAELETQIILAKDLGYIKEETFESLSESLLVIQKMLNSLISKCKQKLKTDV